MRSPAAKPATRPPISPKRSTRSYQMFTRDFGEAAARLVAQSSRDAIAWMEALVTTAGIDCGFERVPGYLYTERASDLDSLADELDAARRAGCAVEWTDEVPLAVSDRRRRALGASGAGACHRVPRGRAHGGRRSRVAASTRTPEWSAFTRTTRAASRPTAAPCAHPDVFVAANVPINNRVLLHTKIAAYRSYAIAGATSSPIPSGLFWDTDDPYHYIAHSAAERTDLSHRRRRRPSHGRRAGHRGTLRAAGRLRARALRGRSGWNSSGRARSSSRSMACRSSAATQSRSVSTSPPATPATA